MAVVQVDDVHCPQPQSVVYTASFLDPGSLSDAQDPQRYIALMTAGHLDTEMRSNKSKSILSTPGLAGLLIGQYQREDESTYPTEQCKVSLN